MRLRLFSLLALLGAVCALFAGCGSHGHAEALTPPVSVKLAGGVGTAAFDPIHAIHIAAYYRGHALPVTGAQTPAELRKGSCLGPVVAPLTDGTPRAQTASDAPHSVAIADASGGMDVAVEPSDKWYVVVFDHANDPSAQIVACGHPLSGLRQYFDLYTAAEGSNGIALGTALIAPVVATHIQVSLASAQHGTGSATWALRTGSCTGSALASGTVTAGATASDGVVFQQLDTHNWWLQVTPASGSASCAQVAAG